MQKPLALILGTLALVGLAGCEPVPGADGPDAAAGAPVSLPESVASIAAPHQDLSTARLRMSDGCYWYTHRGPVETTPLPLRTVNGNPICTRSSS